MTHTWIFPQLLLPHHNPNPPPLHTLFLLIRSIVCIHWRCNSYLVYWSTPIILHCALVHCTCTATIAANMVDHCFAIYFCYFTNTHSGSNTNHWACKLQHIQLFFAWPHFQIVFKVDFQHKEKSVSNEITMDGACRNLFDYNVRLLSPLFPLRALAALLQIDWSTCNQKMVLFV